MTRSLHFARNMDKSGILQWDQRPGKSDKTAYVSPIYWNWDEIGPAMAEIKSSTLRRPIEYGQRHRIDGWKKHLHAIDPYIEWFFCSHYHAAHYTHASACWIMCLHGTIIYCVWLSCIMATNSHCTQRYFHFVSYVVFVFSWALRCRVVFVLPCCCCYVFYFLRTFSFDISYSLRRVARIWMEANVHGMQSDRMPAKMCNDLNAGLQMTTIEWWIWPYWNVYFRSQNDMKCLVFITIFPFFG